MMYPGSTCGSCEITSDDFSSAVALDFWTLVSGAWSVTGGYCTITTDQQCVVVKNTLHPGGNDQSQAAEVKVKFTGPGLTNSGLCLAYHDASNWLAVTLLGNPSGDCSRVELYQRVGGVTTRLSTGITGIAAEDVYHTLLGCYDHEESTLSAKLTTSDGTIYRVGPTPCTPTNVGDQAGLVTIYDVAWPSQERRFDDFKYFRHKKDGNCCCPDCRPGCTLFSDGFDTDRAVNTDVCVWYAPTGWKVENGALVGVSGAGLFWQRCMIELPTDFKVQCKVKISANSTLAGITITPGLSTTDYAAVIVTDDGGSGAGTLRLRTRSGGGAWSTLGLDVPIPSLPKDQAHTLSICYRYADGLLSTTLTTAAGNSYGHHARNITIDRSTYHFLYAQVEFDAAGTYYFDDFTIWELQRYADHYYDCPCCRIGCELASDDFEDGSIASNWDQISGTWSETSGELRTSSANAQIAHKSSWSGFGDDCESDDTSTSEIQFRLSDYSDSAGILLDWKASDTYHSATVTLASNAIETIPGTISFLKKNAGVNTLLGTINIAGLLPGVTHTLRACFIGDKLLAVVNGSRTRYESTATTPLYGTRVGLTASAGGGNPAAFLSWEKSHNIYSDDCPDCWEDDWENCCLCEDQKAPELIKLRLAGFKNPVGEGNSCPDLNGTYLLEFGGSGNCPDTGTLDMECDVAFSVTYCSYRSAFADIPLVGLVTTIDVHLVKIGTEFWFYAQIEIGPVGDCYPRWWCYRGLWTGVNPPDCLHDIDDVRLELQGCSHSSAPGCGTDPTECQYCDLTDTYLVVNNI